MKRILLLLIMILFITLTGCDQLDGSNKELSNIFDSVDFDDVYLYYDGSYFYNFNRNGDEPNMYDWRTVFFQNEELYELVSNDDIFDYLTVDYSKFESDIRFGSYSTLDGIETEITLTFRKGFTSRSVDIPILYYYHPSKSLTLLEDSEIRRRYNLNVADGDGISFRHNDIYYYYFYNDIQELVIDDTTFEINPYYLGYIMTVTNEDETYDYYSISPEYQRAFSFRFLFFENHLIDWDVNDNIRMTLSQYSYSDGLFKIDFYYTNSGEKISYEITPSYDQSENVINIDGILILNFYLYEDDLFVFNYHVIEQDYTGVYFFGKEMPEDTAK